MHNYSLLVSEYVRKISVLMLNLAPKSPNLAWLETEAFICYRETLAALGSAYRLHCEEVLVQTSIRKLAILSEDYRDILQSVQSNYGIITQSRPFISLPIHCSLITLSFGLI
jgi:hypothetical protein